MSESLTEFLLARIAEDEGVAQFVASQQVGDGPDYSDAEYHWHDEYDLLYVYPARVLAECEAKRRIVVLHGKPHRCRMWDFEGVTDRRDPCDTLRALALPYADHDDYRKEWKP